MARPTELDLTTEHDVRRVPMTGANSGIDVVPLASHPDDFVLLARFPAGFERSQRGGYRAAETFVVLEGELDIEGHVVSRGDLTHIPAHHVRGPMRTAEGCTALAWFSGPATYLPAEDLDVTEDRIRTVALPPTATELLLETPEATWSVRAADEEECVDLDLTLWRASGSTDGGALTLVRTRR